MKIHEFQAKQLFNAYNIPIPKGRIAKSAEEISQAVKDSGAFPLVIKAQVHAGGRGKGGGIKIVHTIEEATKASSELLGKTLITPQTGEEGKPVNHLLIEEVLDVAKEIYLGSTIDRVKACIDKQPG